ncbi:hypothetical protein [Microvirus mar63]|uniref:Peptidase M15A C-terminal domain-containing protein n=1 Tax=Microvirus mar63 TaxID=2851200 RepID=A0A8F5RC60_9VIRU|nr:hypothetical protein [Microvirus mar63]
MNERLMQFVGLMLRLNMKFTVTSAFRTPQENSACGGSPTSQHLTGDALDFKVQGMTSSELVDWIKKREIRYDQLIQYRTFVHISFRRSNQSKERQMFLDFR